MKKFLSVVTGLSVAVCGSTLLAACGEKKNPPKQPPQPSFAVENNLEERAAAMMKELKKAYNLTSIDSELKDKSNYTFEGVKTLLEEKLAEDPKKDEKTFAADADYYITVATLSNIADADVANITVGDHVYDKGEDVRLSIGDNNFIVEDAFMVEQGKLRIAAPVVAFELRYENSTLKVNNLQAKKFITAEAADALGLSKYQVKNMAGEAGTLNTATPVQDKTNEYNLKLRTGNEYLLLTPDTAEPKKEKALDATNGEFWTRTTVEGEADTFGITGVDEGGLGMFFGRKADGSVDATINGKDRTMDVYYTATTTEDETETTDRRTGSFTFHVDANNMEVAENIKTNTTAVINTLNSKVYNKLGENQTKTWAETKQAITGLGETDYYVTIGKFEENVTKVLIDGVTYKADKKVKLSVGYNSYIEDKAFTYEAATKTLKVAAPILAFSMNKLDTIEVNDLVCNFVEATNVGELQFTAGQVQKFGDTAKNTIKNTAVNKFDVEIRDSRDMFVVKTAEGLNGGYLLTRNKKTNSSASFGLTAPEFNGYGFYLGYNEEGTPNSDYDGRKEYEVSYIKGNEIKTAKIVLNVSVIRDTAALQKLITDAGDNATVKLDCDYEIDNTINFENKNITFNLYAHSIKSIAEGDFTTVTAMFNIKDSKVTVEGRGKVDAGTNHIFVVEDTDYNKESKDEISLTIENGTFTTTGTHAVYVKKGKVQINDGSFKADFDYSGYPAITQNLTLNILDNAGGEIVVSGGEFYNFNVGTDNKTEVRLAGGVQTEAETRADGTWYTVAPKVGTFTVANETELREVFANAADGSTIKLTESFNLTDQIDVDKELTFDLNGKTLTEAFTGNKSNKAMIFVDYDGHLTVTDSSQEGNGTLKTDDIVAIWLYGTKLTKSTLVIEKGHFEAGTHAVYVTYGQATINGGSFSSKNTELTINIKDDSKLTEEEIEAGKKEKATIVINGGEFKDFEPGKTNKQDPGISLGENKKVTKDETTHADQTWYKVENK